MYSLMPVQPSGSAIGGGRKFTEMARTTTDWSDPNMQAAAADYSRRCASVEDAARELQCSVRDLTAWRKAFPDDRFTDALEVDEARMPDRGEAPEADSSNAGAAEIIRRLLDFISPSIQESVQVRYRAANTCITADSAVEVPAQTVIPWTRQDFRPAYSDVECIRDGRVMRIHNASVSCRRGGRVWDIRRLITDGTIANQDLIVRRVACLAELIRDDGVQGTDIAKLFGDDKQRIGYIRRRIAERISPQGRGLKGVRHTTDPRRGVTKQKPHHD